MRSLANNLKIHFVLQSLQDKDVDIACITETWLSPELGHNHTISIIESFGYNISFTARKGRKGGGVAFLLKSNLKFAPIKPMCNYTSFEWHGIRLIGRISAYRLLCIYRKQEFTMKIFLEEFSHFLLSFSTNISDEIIILGDFNVHFEQDKDCALTNLLQEYGLSQSVTRPTRISGYILDLIYSNSYSLPLLPEVSEDMIKTTTSQIKFDHFPIFFQLVDEFQAGASRKEKYEKTFRRINQIDSDAFYQFLKNKLSTDLEGPPCSFQQHLAKYNNCLVSALDTFAPLQTKTVVTSSEVSSPPWMDSEYKKERSLRRKCEKQQKIYGDSESNRKYVKQRDYCIFLADSKMKSYYSDFSASTNNQSTLFKKVAKLWKFRKTRDLPDSPTDYQQLANDFNSFFSNKIHKIRESLEQSEPKNINVVEPQRSFGSLHQFTPATQEELEQIISDMDIKTSIDDPLPASLLKSSLPLLMPHILELVNLSLSTGNINGLKESVITPILKKAGLDKNILGNYRPIVNLQFLSKVIEKVVLKRLTSHMSLNNLHCHQQFGYKKHHSTETMLLQIVNDVLVGFERNSGTVLVLLDMSSAFDTVDLKKLLSILEDQIKIKGTALLWFRSFLLDRVQKVLINGQLSDVLLTLYGVPQGSVLGPVLFNIYVSNLPSFIEQYGFLSSSYADDTNARIKFALKFQLYNVSVKVPNLIEEITDWMTTYFLKINPGKTEVIMFFPPAMKSVPKIQGVFVKNGCVRFSDSVKLLGVQLDPLLNFDAHVCKVVSECWYHLKNIAKIRRYLTNDELKKLVHAVISSKLDYCNSILYGVKSSTLAKLQRVQNEAARTVCGIPAGVSVSDQVFLDLHWLKVKERITFQLLLFIHKHFVDKAPFYFAELLLVKDYSKRLLFQNFMNSLSGRRAFSYAAPRLWNHLPEAVRLEKNTEKFKNLIKTLLFRNHNNIMNITRLYCV